MPCNLCYALQYYSLDNFLCYKRTTNYNMIFFINVYYSLDFASQLLYSKKFGRKNVLQNPWQKKTLDPWVHVYKHTCVCVSFAGEWNQVLVIGYHIYQSIDWIPLSQPGWWTALPGTSIMLSLKVKFIVWAGHLVNGWLHYFYPRYNCHYSYHVKACTI